MNRKQLKENKQKSCEGSVAIKERQRNNSRVHKSGKPVKQGISKNVIDSGQATIKQLGVMVKC